MTFDAPGPKHSRGATGQSSFLVLFFTLAAFLMVSIGCTTTENDSLKPVPWNAARPSDTGVPPGMMQGH